MTTLDDNKLIKKYDRFRMLETIEDFSWQCQQTWKEVKKVKLPKNYRKVKNVVINGMGGSGLPGHMIKELFKEDLRIPLEVINSYSLPWYLNRQTLYLLSSYSGSTEEPISTGKMAAWRQAKILGITTGSKLASFLRRHNYPGYVFNPKYNYCKQPRLGLVYSLTAHLGLLRKLGLLKISDAKMKMVCHNLAKYQKKWGVGVKQKNNQAKQLAKDLSLRLPIIIGSEFLSGNIHTISNQLNENSKTYANYYQIPELNHHLLEGLSNPKINKQLFHFVFIESNLYLPRVQARYRATQKMLKKLGFRFTKIKAVGEDKLDQVFSVLTFGSYLSFYLAVLNKVDPSPIPWVDFFKKELAKHK
ncbi:hypothetical protein KKI23_04265 [Patescibacteria group bacterium]|nr:hypothetical protein [Patescibacteria group bacterium]